MLEVYVSALALVMSDYDGVIVDSLQVFCMNFRAACQENGLREIVTQHDVIALFENNVYKTLLQRGVTAATIDKILQAYERKQKGYLQELQLFTNMADTLQEMAKTAKVFIITSNISSATENVMQRYGVNCIEEVIGAEKEKSKISKIKKVMAQYTDLPAFYIGDTKGDMLEGKEAGAKTIGVTWGWHSIEKLKEGKADFIVQSPQELAALFQK
jgi:phosphoglycolate phosphatase